MWSEMRFSKLECEINELIGTPGEGLHWDFKAQYHQNNNDLLHDVICLANIRHSGDRHIIFGVEDDTHDVQDITAGHDAFSSRINQLLRDNAKKFAGERSPTISLAIVRYNGTPISVLSVKDEPYKPYYLRQDHLGLKAFHIYSRVGSHNTKRDASAPDAEIENLWRERFGIDKSPAQRFCLYLRTTPEQWRSSPNLETYFHEFFPEFTIEYGDSDASIDQHTLEWAREEIGYDLPSGNFTYQARLKYHTTAIASILIASFDGGKKKIVAPDWEPMNGGRIYFYRAGSLKHDFQRYFATWLGQDDSTSIRSTGRFSFAIPVVTDEELSSFLSSLPKTKPMDVIREHDRQTEVFLSNLKALQDHLSRRR